MNSHSHLPVLGLAATLLARVANAQAEPNSLAEIPFILHQNGVIVSAVVNGRDSVRLLLDTGWGPLALLTSSAERLGLPVTSGGEYPLARAISLSLGGAVKRNVSFELFAAERLVPLIGPFDGVLSTAFFHDLVLQIDYPRGVVRFFSAMPRRHATADSAGIGTSLPMVFSPGAGALPFSDSVTVDGHQVRGLFDTGGAGAFLAMPGLVERADLALYPDTSSVGVRILAEGARREARLRVARAGRITVGSMVREVTRLMVAPAQIEGGSWGHDLIIGYGFFKDFVVTFDYPGKTISFEPASGR